MKKMCFLLFVLIIGKVSFAQTGTDLSVRNYSATCDGYYQIIMSTASTSSSACSNGWVTSNVITIPAGMTLTYSSTSLPSGISSGNYFVGAKILSGPATCTTITNPIGEPCASLNGNTSLTALTSSCTTCGNFNYIWQPAVVVGTRAYMSINR